MCPEHTHGQYNRKRGDRTRPPPPSRGEGGAPPGAESKGPGLKRQPPSAWFRPLFRCCAMGVLSWHGVPTVQT